MNPGRIKPAAVALQLLLMLTLLWSPALALGQAMARAGWSETGLSAASRADPARATSQVITVEVALERSSLDTRLTAIVRRFGKEERRALLDDGSVMGDQAGDWIHTARFSGPPARFVELELLETSSGAPRTFYKRIVALRDLRTPHLSYFLELKNGRLITTPAVWLPAQGQSDDTGSRIALDLAFGWGALCLLYVGLLIALGRRREDA